MALFQMLNLVDDEMIQKLIDENQLEKPYQIQNKQGNVKQLYSFIKIMKKAKQLIQQLSYAIQSLLDKNKALVKKFGNQLNEQQILLENQGTERLELEVKLKQKIKDLQIELEESQLLFEKQSEEKNNIEENYQQQIKKLRTNLNDQYAQYESKCAELDEMEEQIDQLNQQINECKLKVQKECFQKNELQSEVEQQRSQSEKLKIIKDAAIRNNQIQIDILTEQVTSLQNRLKDNEDEQSKQSIMIREQKNKFDEKEEERINQQVSKNLKDVQQQLKTKTKELEQMDIMLDESVKKQHALSLQANSLEGQIRQLNLQYDNLQRNFNAVKQSESELMETNKRMMEDFTKQVQEDNQRFRAEIEFKDIIIKKVCTNQQDKYIDKIIGPMEKIMNSEFKINRYQEDPNIKRDNTEYIVHEIGYDRIKAQNLMKEQKWMCFDECLQYQTLGSAKTIRSIQPNADVTLLKGYIIQIEEIENGGLKDKKLLRKEYKSQATPMLSTKEEAGKLSLNNMLCKFLFQKYNSMQGFPKIQGKQIQIQRQFVLQVKGKEEYCYCEMIVEEQPFEKINGGTFQVKDTELHQYLNAFSLFTYHIMNRQLIISNLQVVGQYLHDMIVSTQYKIFTPIDQGSSEIAQTLGILEKAPQAYLSKFWNEKIEQQAKQGWK